MKKVLVVDDDAVARLVLRFMLERQGFEVTEAESVDSALVIIHGSLGKRATDSPGSVFDLIVCDYVMRDRNGLDLLEEVEESAVPFVLLTGELNRESLTDDRVGGVSAYVTKPVATDELKRVVSDLVPA